MIEAETMPKTTREPVPKPPPDYPPDGPLGDLLAAEAMLDLLRLAVERDFSVGFVECRQESAAIAAGHALRLVHRARLAYAEALAVAVSARAAAAVSETRRGARRG